MSEVLPYHLYIFYTVHLVGAINRVHDSLVVQTIALALYGPGYPNSCRTEGSVDIAVHLDFSFICACELSYEFLYLCNAVFKIN